MRVIEAGGMELDKLHVFHAATCAPAHGDAVTGRNIRVGGIEVDFACATGSQYRIGCQDGFHPVTLLVVNVGAPAALVCVSWVFLGDQIDRDVFFQNSDVRVGGNLDRQRIYHGSTGSISGVDDATMTVTTFTGQMVAVLAGFTIFIPGERHAQINQPINGRAGVLDDEAGSLGIAQASSGNMGIADMHLDAVGISQYGSDPALRPATPAFT